MSATTERIAESFVRIGATSTRILEVVGSRPPILLLHGFTDSADTWRPVLGELAAAGHRAVAVDLPGGGFADALGRPALDELDSFVDAFVAEYGEPGCVMVGNSLGGLLALRAATRPGSRVGAVVGIGPAGLAYGWRLDLLEKIARRLDPVLRLLDLAPVPTGVVRRAAARFYERRLAAGCADPELGRRYASHLHGMRDLGRLRSDLIALSAESRNEPIALDRLGVPVQLIWGGKDRLADIRGAAPLLAQVPGSRLELLDDCGHCPQVEAPERVVRLLLSHPAANHAEGDQ